MKWSEMTPFERDQLIAEKVMGWQAKECDGEIGEKPISPDGWYCQKCGHDGYWGDDCTHEELPPRYTKSMATAWRVVDAMRSYHRPLLSQATRADLTIADIFLVQLWELTGRHGIDALFAYTPEMICLAALRAVGVDIEE